MPHNITMKDNVKILLSATGIACGAYVSYLVRLYGVAGVARLVWEGGRNILPIQILMQMFLLLMFRSFIDHLTKDERNDVDKLTMCSRKLDTINKRIDEVNRYMELEKLKCLDDGAFNSEQVCAFSLDGGIRTKMGNLSSDLDGLAAKIDSVIVKRDGPQYTEEIATMKKNLSKRIVLVMNAADKLMELLLDAESRFKLLADDAVKFYDND